MSDTTKLCPECGRRARLFRDGSTLGWHCSDCPWTVLSHDYRPPVFDYTLYTVWLHSPDQDRRSLIVRLAAVLGTNVDAVREIVDSGQPIATSISAGKVCHLYSMLAKTGIQVRIEPPFRWPTHLRATEVPSRLSSS